MNKLGCPCPFCNTHLPAMRLLGLAVVECDHCGARLKARLDKDGFNLAMLKAQSGAFYQRFWDVKRQEYVYGK